MKRVRIVGYLVQPQLMIDDGENLTPLQVNAVTIAPPDWPRVIELMAAGVQQLREQLEQPPDDDDPTWPDARDVP